jgi:hypothetical protein
MMPTEKDEEHPAQDDTQTESTVISTEPKIEPMEVHHHPDLHHKKKHWKEYFLEFLMIFLAVTLGFLADNLREQFKDHKQLHQYIQSLNQDLVDDMTMYDSSVSINQNNCRMIDTLITLLQSRNEIAKIYILARRLTMGHGIFTPNSKTFEQLKSIGGLRLIENQRNLDSINAYYQLLKTFDYWSNLQRQRINTVIEGNDKLFDGAAFFSIYKILDQSGTIDESALIPKPALLTNDPLVVNGVIMHYQYFYGLLKIIDRKALEASENAARLSNLLVKEYDLN